MKRPALFTFVCLAMLGLGQVSPAIAQTQVATAVAPLSESECEKRAKALLVQMTPAEKLAQITAHWIPAFRPEKEGDPVLDEAWLLKTMPNGIGSIGPCNFSLEEDVASRNLIRKTLRQKTRLGIPPFFHDEACHGLMKPETTSFPMPIGLASSWDTELVERSYDAIAREARARGTHHVLTPVVDLSLDPRWGRTEETLSEDPYLVGRLGVAIIKGFQGGASGDIDGKHVMSTLKHLAGHSVPEGGLNRSPSHVGPLELRETHLAPFRTIIREAKPATIMPCYNEVDGIPSHANPHLLKDIVRGEYGFRGLFVSDYDGVAQLWREHKVAASATEAAILTLESGVQMELPVPETFSQLEPLLKDNPRLTKLVDDAVMAVLIWKLRLGLFEEGDTSVEQARAAVDNPEHRALALRAARESIVLLKNDAALLPLKPGAFKRIAVIGPNAKPVRLGGYSGIPTNPVSLLEGLRRVAGDKTEFLHAEGCRIANQDTHSAYRNWKGVIDVAPADPADDKRLMAEAKAVAEKADLIILALGENEVVCRESWAVRKLGDVASLELPGAQQELADAMIALGKPVVLVLQNGRPLAIPELAAKVPAILEMWYAGQEGGTAAAEILFGQVNPSGKLAVSIPKSAGHLPVQYRRKPLSGPYTYLFSDHQPLFPFGFGLSYTKFEYSNLKCERAQMKPGEKLSITVDIKNTGEREGVEIAQLYLRDEVSSVTRPVKELRGFQRVNLKAGESKTLRFEISEEELAFHNASQVRVIEPGWFTVQVGSSSESTIKSRFEFLKNQP